MPARLSPGRDLTEMCVLGWYPYMRVHARCAVRLRPTAETSRASRPSRRLGRPESARTDISEALSLTDADP